MLVKLADGISFKMFQINDQFDTHSQNSAVSDANKVQQAFKNLFHVPFKTIVPPVFVKDVAVFFIVDESNVGWLYFYVWNVPANFFEMKQRVSVSSSVTGDWQNESSLIRSNEGVIYKENGVAGIYHFKTTDYSWTKTTITIDKSMVTSSAAVWTEANLVLR